MAIQGIGRRVLAAAIVGLSIAWLVWTFNGFTLSDSHAYRVAAERLLAGADLYQPAATQDEAFRYAPWFAAAWIPLAALPEAVGSALWAVLLLVASVVAVLPLARRNDVLARLLAVLGGTVLLWTTARGNVHPLVMVALVHGLHRRSGPVWVALAASLKAVPLLFVLVYVARREWLRAVWTLAIAAALVAPMPFLGWEADTVQPGPSLSLYYQVSPVTWLIVAGIALALAVAVALRAPRLAAPATAVAAILALPRLLLYDLTYLLVGADDVPATASTGAKMEAPGPS
jgi:glycosyl transferase family 87